ncbi:hypothetical protein CDIK_1998 [Cucumispora dikerogammari]|nr:hypothetical protein CDIK_1998 [Cucumispora dikerogammari]
MFIYRPLNYLFVYFHKCERQNTQSDPIVNPDINTAQQPNKNFFSQPTEPKEKIPTHKLADKPQMILNNNGEKQTGYFLQPNMGNENIPNFNLDPRCEIVVIDGKKTQLCPNNLYSDLQAKNKNKENKEPKNLDEIASKLSEMFKGNPDISKSLAKIFTDDNLQLWNQISDIDSKQQHQLPSPKGLFNRARDKLNVLTHVKESLSQELLTTEKLVKRVKAYLDENKEALQRNIPIMKEILQKLPSVHDSVMQNDLAKRYVRLHKEEMEALELYNTEKDWLVEVLSLFGSLFALT